MLSNFSRWLTLLSASLYAVVGALLFVFPETLAPVFAWRVTAFMVMTIGGWCLGNAWLAWVCARRWTWGLVYSALIYLWLFGIGELIVLYLFRDKLILAHPIAWLYLVTLIVNAAAALVGLSDWLRLKPPAEPAGLHMPTVYRIAAMLYILFVGFLGLYGSTVQLGAPGTNGGIFPEAMSLFTLRSFGVFYLALALSVIPLLWEKDFNTLLNHGFASFGLIMFITLAALVYIRLFDFSAKPGGLAYLAAYFAVGITFLLTFRKFGTGLDG
jgi:hypothetical protein